MDRETVSEIVRHSLNEAFAGVRGKGAGEWTGEVKAQLCLAGGAQQPPLYVCASGVEGADSGEWLYDVCWLRRSRRNPLAERLEDPSLDWLNEAVLILECERAGADGSRIGDAFQRLMVGRARVRCMIWEDDRGEDDTGVAEWLVEMTSECLETAPDDFYLLARYTGRGFQCWHLHGNGTVYPM